MCSTFVSCLCKFRAFIVSFSCVICDTCLGLCVEFDTLVYYTKVVKQGASCLFEGNFIFVFVV